MPNELMRIDEKIIKAVKDMMPSYDKGDKRHVSRVKNAWAESTFLDEQTGILYVKSTRLHDILRMARKADAQYLVDSLPKRSKLNRDGECYIASCEVLKELDRRMTGATIKQKGYLGYSEEVFRSIRESPEVRIRQEEIRQQREELMKQLKRQRIKALNVKYDELTKEPLQKSTAEFSHIRKKALFTYEAVNIYNGLIVNQDTHRQITNANLQDEEDLLVFASEKNWSIEWYDVFVSTFN